MWARQLHVSWRFTVIDLERISSGLGNSQVHSSKSAANSSYKKNEIYSKMRKTKIGNNTLYKYIISNTERK